MIPWVERSCIAIVEDGQVKRQINGNIHLKQIDRELLFYPLMRTGPSRMDGLASAHGQSLH
jgi:hypothetical protein